MKETFMKNKLLLFLSVFVLNFTIVNAHDFDLTVNGVYFCFNFIKDSTEVEVTYYDDGEVSLIYHYSSYTSIRIPETVSYKGKTYTVTSIGDNAIIDVGESVKYLEIPNTVNNISKTAISLPGLTNIVFPDNLFQDLIGSLISTPWFNSWRDTQDDGVLYMNDVCVGYKGDESASFNVNIKEGTKAICSSAFSGLSNLSSVNIPSSVKTIGSDAFAWCRGLASINISNGLTSIGACAFSNCFNLTSVNIPITVTEIGKLAFYGCHELKSIELPKSLKIIENQLFWSCSKLESIIIPDSVDSIKLAAFAGCSNLRKIVIGKSVNFIDRLNSLSSLDSIIVDKSNPYFENGENYDALIESKSKTLIQGTNRITAIPETVTAIGSSAFSGCKDLSLITIPNSVSIIGESAFINCSNLKFVIIPNSVTSIGDLAFSGCNNLQFAFIPASVVNVGKNVFRYCNKLTDLFWLSNGTNDFSSLSSLKRIFTIESSAVTFNGISANVYNLSTDLPNWKEKEFIYNGVAPKISLPISKIDSIDIVSIDSVVLFAKAGLHTTSVPCVINYKGNFFGDIPLTYSYTIKKAPLIANVNNVSREYGEENPELTFTYEGFVNGETDVNLTGRGAVSTKATKTSNVGEYDITLTGLSSDNYDITIKSGKLTITKAPLVAKINDASREYGENNLNFTSTYFGLKNGEKEPVWSVAKTLSTTATKGSDVGKYPITMTGEPRNYDLTVEEGTLTITPAPLQVKATNKSRLYKTENPDLTYTCMGFKNGDDERSFTKAPNLSTTATKNSDAGTYPIIVGDVQSNNYDITTEDAILTINKRKLNVTTDNASRAYGEDNPDFVVKYSGFVEGEDDTYLEETPKANTTATLSSNVGTYPIYIEGGLAKNYDFVRNNATLTITKAYQTITWEQELDHLEWYTNTELTAESSSGLPITYTVSNPDICSIIQIGDKIYLECTGAGRVVITATQSGDDNHFEALKVFKMVDIIATGIDAVTMNKRGEGIKYITPDGRMFDKPQKGVNIIRLSDGGTQKIFVK